MSQNDYGELSDAEIWEIFKAGDKEAFTYIFNQNIRILYKYGHKFAPSMHLVEDYIQELFLTLWKNRSNLRLGGSFKNLMIKGMNNIGAP